MKRLLALILLNNIFVIYNYVKSASVGDYRTAQSSVTWSSASHWQTWDGSNWNTASSPPGNSNDVYIQSGHTVTLSSNESCNSIYLSTGTTSSTAGSDALIELQSYTLNVYGKLCCYYGVVDINNGSSSSLSITTCIYVPSLAISKSTGGVLKLVGSSRNITNTGEWGAGSGSSSLFDIEIALNTGETAVMQTTIKACNWNISSGALNIGSNSISVDNGTTGQGDITISDGAILISSGSGTSNAIIQRTGASACGTLNLNGTLKTSALNPYLQCASYNFGTNGTIEFNDNGNQNFINTNSTSGTKLLNYKHVVLSGSGNKTTLTGENTQISSDGSLTIKGGTLIIGSGGNFNVSATNTTLIYQGSSAQSISSTEWNSDFQNLKINNSAGVSMSGFSRTLNGNLYLLSGTFSNGSNLTLGNSSEILITDGVLGSPPTFGSSINITYNQSSVSVNTGNEIPSSSSVLQNFTINNTNGLTLNSVTTVNGTLSLTAGKITSSSSYILSLSSGAIVSGSSSSSFIIGPLKKTGSADFTYPIGKSNVYAPVRITSNSGSSSDYFIAEYFNSSPSNRSSLGTGLTGGNVSSVEYWDINPNSTQTANVSLYWNSTASGISNLASSHLVVAHYNSGNWISDDNIASSGSSSSGYVTSGTVSSWGNFTFGSPNNQNPLPVIFLNFEVKNMNEFEKILEWQTATEANCFGFEIQKSSDSVNFETIDFVYSKAIGGNSSLKLRYNFKYFEPNCNKMYYRLKQFDLNGEHSYSPIVKSNYLSYQSKIFIINDVLYINSINENNQFFISNINGKQTMENFVGFNYCKDLSEMNEGFYIIRLNNLKPLKIFLRKGK